MAVFLYKEIKRKYSVKKEKVRCRKFFKRIVQADMHGKNIEKRK
jgi:hypothetical protein